MSEQMSAHTQAVGPEHTSARPTAEEAAGSDKCPACLGYPRPHKPDLCPPPTRWQRIGRAVLRVIDDMIAPCDAP